MNNDLISRSEAKKLGATCLARRNENGQLEAIISLDNAPTVEERPKYILKVKNLTAEGKKRFQEEWNKSAGGLLVVSDDYKIVPLTTTKLVTVTNKQGKEFEAYYDESRELVFEKSYTRELLTSLGYTITIKEEQLRGE